MYQKFLVLLVCLLLFPFIGVAADTPTSVSGNIVNMATTDQYVNSVTTRFVEGSQRPGSIVAKFDVDEATLAHSTPFVIDDKQLMSYQVINSSSGTASGAMINGNIKLYVSSMVGDASPAGTSTLTTLYEPYVEITDSNAGSLGLRWVDLRGYRKAMFVLNATSALNYDYEVHANFLEE